MNREAHIAMNFMIYVILPFAGLRAVMMNYPGVVEPFMAEITMLYFLFLFVLASLSLYLRYPSLCTVISVAVSIVYINFALTSVRFFVDGAKISVNLSAMLLVLYILLSVKILVSVYSDVKQKHLSSSAD